MRLQWALYTAAAAAAVAATPSCGPGQKFLANGNGGVCAQCPPLTYVNDTAPHTVSTCTPQDFCGQGERFVDSQTAPRQCVPCASETFQDYVSHFFTECTPWRVCNASDGQHPLPTTDPEFDVPPSDRRDQACNTSRECDITREYEKVLLAPELGQARQCAPLKVCPPGTYVYQQPTLSDNRICRFCTNGTYTTTTNAASCTTHSLCGAGHRVNSSSVTPTADVTCVPCGAGTYAESPLSRPEVCTLCENPTCTPPPGYDDDDTAKTVAIVIGVVAAAGAVAGVVAVKAGWISWPSSGTHHLL